MSCHFHMDQVQLMKRYNNSAKKEPIPANLKEELKAAEDAIDDWADPRESTDRRQRNTAKNLPSTGCNRKKDRRVTSYIRDDQWWLHRNYIKSEN